MLINTSDILFGALVGMGLQLISDESVTKQQGGEPKQPPKKVKDKKVTTYERQLHPHDLIVPQAFERVILILTKMGIDTKVKTFFTKIHDVLLTIKITPEFCCEQKGELFDLLDDGIKLLKREHRHRVMQLAKQWRIQKCEEEFSDWKSFCDAWKLNTMALQTAKAKSDFAVQQKKDERSIELRHSIKRSIWKMTESIGEKLIISGISSYAAREVLDIIPRYLGSIGRCETTTHGWFGSNTIQEDSWMCEHRGSDDVAGIFASVMYTILNTIGTQTETLTSDLRDAIAMLIFLLVFLITIIFRSGR